jgi:hypothetical protein
MLTENPCSDLANRNQVQHNSLLGASIGEEIRLAQASDIALREATGFDHVIQKIRQPKRALLRGHTCARRSVDQQIEVASVAVVTAHYGAKNSRMG